MPSSSPSFDPQPTYDIVRSRGEVRCGVFSNLLSVDKTGTYRGFSIDLVSAQGLCSAIYVLSSLLYMHGLTPELSFYDLLISLNRCEIMHDSRSVELSLR